MFCWSQSRVCSNYQMSDERFGQDMVSHPGPKTPNGPLSSGNTRHGLKGGFVLSEAHPGAISPSSEIPFRRQKPHGIKTGCSLAAFSARQPASHVSRRACGSSETEGGLSQQRPGAVERSLAMIRDRHTLSLSTSSRRPSGGRNRRNTSGTFHQRDMAAV